MNKFIDLTGKQFGDWTVLKRDESKARYWICQCKCGVISSVNGYSLTSGASKSCGHTDNKSLKGKQFGEWTVLEEPNEQHKALCKCSCGKERLVNIYTLKSGKSISCGHMMNQDRLLDLKGRVFGSLTVECYIGKGKWECRCSCGKLVIKSRTHLLDGRAHSCGHGTNKEPENLKGRVFGKLTVIDYVGNKRWLCKCSCGNTKVIMAANLKNNSTISCGCVQYTPTKDELLLLIEQFKTKNNFNPSISDLAMEANITYECMYYHLCKYDLMHSNTLLSKYSSQQEREIYKYIDSITDLEVTHNIRGLILDNKDYELDIYIPELRLGIEFNGTYWHSTVNKSANYHKNKTIDCIKSGIKLIHIFEYEWNNPEKQLKIKNLLYNRVNKERNIQYARNMFIQEISSKEACEFYDRYHLQNGVNAIINIAIVDKLTDEIYGVMSFGQPRFDTDNTYELYRLAYKDNIFILGGSEKLFKYFVTKYKPDSIVSYCDISKFMGNVYDKLGFKFNGISKPNYVWVNSKTNEVLSRYQTQKHKLLKLGLGSELDTENDIMTRLGYLKVYDCGNAKCIWNNSESI